MRASRIHALLYPLLLVTLLSLAAGICLAQSGQPSQTMDLSLKLRVIRGSEVLTSPAVLVVEFLNNNDLTLTVKEVTFETVPGWTLISDVDLTSCADIQLPPNGRRRCSIRFPGVTASRDWLSWTTLTFSPGSYPLILAARVESDLREVQDFYGEEVIALSPPISSLLRGGILGSLLMALFVVVRRWRLTEPTEQKYKHLRSSAVEFVALLCFGLVVTSMTILLLQRISGLDLPLSIEVQDYLGGFVVGVLSLRVGDSVYRLMFGEPNLPDPSGKEGVAV